MKLNKGLCANPILCEQDNDYVDGFFTASFDLLEASLSVSLQLEEPAIERRIAAGEAAYLVHVECPLTSYRKKYLLGSKNRTTIPLPLADLGGDVEVSTYIVAAQEIEGFTSDGLNADYAGLSLTYPKGSLLAIGPIDTLEIQHGGSGAQTLPEIFEICGDIPAGDKKTYWVDPTSDTIKIHVTPRIRKFYADHAAQKALTNQLLVLPAATETLMAVAIANDHGDEDWYSDATWYKIFDETLRRSGLAMTELTMKPGKKGTAAQVAQMLFRQPLPRAIDALSELVDAPAMIDEKIRKENLSCSSCD